MDFNFSANTGYLWKELPFIDRIKMAKRHDFNSLEFHDEAHKENLTELKSLLSETELNVNGMNVRMGDTFGCAAIPDQSEKAKNEIKEAIKIAEDLGARALHIMSGVTEYNQTSIKTFVSNLKFALDNSKILILIEPVCEEQLPGYFLKNIDQAAAIINKIDHPRLKIMFDCYHIYRESGDLVKNFQIMRIKLDIFKLRQLKIELSLSQELLTTAIYYQNLSDLGIKELLAVSTVRPAQQRAV